MRPNVLRRFLMLAAFGAVSAGLVVGDFLAWAVTR